MAPIVDQPDRVREILVSVRTIAVVGISAREQRDSHRVAAYLADRGYEILPVNPALQNVLGRRCYPSVSELPVVPDMVDVFRRADAVLPFVDEAIAIGARVLWLPDGVVNDEAARRATQAGLDVVMDRCAMRDHFQLLGGDRPG